MPSLEIQGFSCIDYAELEVGAITVLIGPQASGKSVISKLLYFFGEMYADMFKLAEDGNSYRQFQKIIGKKFTIWFPPSAWGSGPFRINYSAGAVRVSIERKLHPRKVGDDVNVEISMYLRQIYDDLLASYRRVNKHFDSEEDGSFVHRYDRNWPIFREGTKRLESELGSDYVANQMFVPAGRSFYTNLGKAVAILEHGSHLDDVTKAFGRRFTSLLDRGVLYYGEKPSTRTKEFVKHQKSLTEGLFGGQLKLASNDMHVATPDGRKVPLSTLSSGQQELLPLMLILQLYTSGLARPRGERRGSDYLYVEEPEAHLFPESQGKLIQHLVETANFGRGAGRLLITTHSPYVLAKLNNLIQAWLTASANEEAEVLTNAIIPRNAWLAPSNLKAYAIRERQVSNIVDETGLIDATYLDSISNDINEDFMRLLEIEAGQ